MQSQRTLWKVSSAIGIFIIAASGFIASEFTESSAQELANACPVEGCEPKIANVELVGGEIAMTFESNFKPDLSKNHLHVWWGDNFTVKQVSGNAETIHGVKQGDWHPTDSFPIYKTQGAVSTAVRNGSKLLCVSAADRNHDILDVNLLHCVDVSGLF